MTQKNKFWNVKTDGKNSRIDLFGFVGGSKEWNDGFNEQDFLNEFRAIPADNALDISINSFGGAVYTALSIYTLLKAHKGAITFRIDGAAMSAATIITSVPNAKVIMPKGSMMMIHKVSSIVMGNTDDFRKAADDMEKLEQNILDIYAEKTGKSIEDIKPLVDAETYFTAAEAVEFGLADELDESTVVKNVATGAIVSLNGLEVEAKMFERMPKNFLNTADEPQAAAKQNPVKEVKTMTLEQLKAEHPEIVEAIRAEAVKDGIAQERSRIQAIEEIAMVGHEDLIQSAKYGEHTMTAEQLAMAMLKAEKAKKQTALEDRVKDAAVINEVPTAVGHEGIEPTAKKPMTMAEKIAEEKAKFEAAKNLK